MTSDQKTIERYEFSCEDGHEAIIGIYKRTAELSEGDHSDEAMGMRVALRSAFLSLESAASLLSEAYDAVGAYEKAQRRKGPADA